MKRVATLLTSYLFIFSCNLCFSQSITKSELKRIIKESRKEERKDGFSYFSKIISNNKDSIFFNSNTIDIYTSEIAASKEGFCRTIELKFLHNNKVNFIDCQTCREPTSCYVTTSKNIYKYRIKEIENELYVFFKNTYAEMHYKIISSKKYVLDNRKYFKLKLEKINYNN